MLHRCPRAVLMFDNIADLCDPHQKDHFICPGQKTFATSAIIWGGIGPKRLFSQGGLYLPRRVLLPHRRHPPPSPVTSLPAAILSRCGALSISRPPFAGIAQIPPRVRHQLLFLVHVWRVLPVLHAQISLQGELYIFLLPLRSHVLTNLSPVVDTLQLHSFRRTDSGLAISLIVIYFTVQFPKGGFNVNWWGKHRLVEHCGRLGPSLLHPSRKPNIRAHDMVMTCLRHI